MATALQEKNCKKYEDRYKRNGCTKEQLTRLVELKAIAPECYEKITGEPYQGEETE